MRNRALWQLCILPYLCGKTRCQVLPAKGLSLLLWSFAPKPSFWQDAGVPWGSQYLIQAMAGVHQNSIVPQVHQQALIVKHESAHHVLGHLQLGERGAQGHANQKLWQGLQIGHWRENLRRPEVLIQIDDLLHLQIDPLEHQDWLAHPQQDQNALILLPYGE